jgi:hypothetical protein
MSFRSSLTKVLGSFWAGTALTLGLFAVSHAGCGGDDPRLTCDTQGKNCQICDSLGCRPANMDTGAGGSGGGMAASTASSSGTGGSGCDPTKSTCGCTQNSDCPSGKECVSGLCISGCNYDYECGAGKVCFSGSCVVGCDATTPCATGYTCDKGGCVLDPTHPACDASNPCPSGQICSNGLCTTGCSDNSMCATGQVCDATSGACIADPGTQPVCNSGKPCPSPQSCLSDGFCHYPCTAVTQCKLIDNRFVACSTAGYCQTDEEVNPACSLTKPCPSGKTCVSSKCQ